MQNIPLLILQYGLGLVFIITSILILKSEDKWMHMLPGWMRKIFPERLLKYLMISTAFYDIAQGIWFFSGFLLGWAGLVAAAHLASIIVTSNRNTIHATYRDMGLFAASLAIAVQLLL